jgi:hypothetical protein
MRADLIGLEWLTSEQALLWLKDQAGLQLSENDLLGQCEVGRCHVYANVDSWKGTCPEGLRDELGELFFTVCGVGRGRILNPRALIEAKGKSEIQLHIIGDVQQIEQAEAERYESVDWLAVLPPEHCHPTFMQSEIAALAQMFSGATPPPDRTKPSHLLTIAVLLELLKEKGRPVYNQDAIVLEISKRYGEESERPVLGLGSSNIKDIFAEANKAMPGAKRKKPKS